MTSNLSVWEELCGASHVGFDADAVIPLQRWRVLSETDIYETLCDSTVLALSTYPTRKELDSWCEMRSSC